MPLPHQGRRADPEEGAVNYPVQVRARRDPNLSRWLWIIKWIMLIPHYVVLFFLWVAFVVLVLVAYVVVLFTGRYPRAIFDFNVGVLRWSWRVGYYGYEVLGTDRYPPFTLADVPDYPAGLEVEHRPNPPRWLPLVAWLLAFPHWLILSALNGAGTVSVRSDDAASVVRIGLVGAAVLVIGVALLFTGRQLTGLYDLLVGIARWSLRVVAYVALLTPGYPPFRLDMGDAEPVDPDPDPDLPPDDATAIVQPTPAPSA
jgi:Domain of unknown function (DUF4389)